jgi:hypothetical protein
MRKRESFAALVVISLSLASAHARADVETNEERAERFFKDAEKKFDGGQIAAACALWSDGLRLAPKLGTLLNIALCHEQQGKVATAWTEFHRGAAWAAQIGQRERQEFAHQHAIVLEKSLPRILLQLPRAREIGTLELDGEPLPEPDWYLPIYLDPGDHTIAVSAPGKTRRTVGISVLPGPSAQAVTIAPLDDEPLPPPPKPLPKDYRLWKAAGGIALVGAGTIATGVGAYFAEDAASKHDDEAAPLILLGAGLGAIMAGGLVLFFTAKDAPPSATPAQKQSALPRLSVSPTLGPRDRGIVAVYTF